MNTEKVRCVVFTPTAQHTYVGTLHCNQGPDGLLMERRFYEAADGVPQGPHHEIELIIMPSVWHDNAHLHVHTRADTQKAFVCYTGTLATRAEAIELFTWWCAGTSHSILHGGQFDTLMVDGEDSSIFLERLKKDFGIVPRVETVA
jgi:hypothetical protein